jgi:hypothetical protein
MIICHHLVVVLDDQGVPVTVYQWRESSLFSPMADDASMIASSDQVAPTLAEALRGFRGLCWGSWALLRRLPRQAL